MPSEDLRGVPSYTTDPAPTDSLGLATASSVLHSPWVSALVSLILIVWRMPGHVAHGYLWAEDVVIFMREANVVGVRAYILPYANYLHLLPRSIAWLTLPLPFTTIPYAYVAATVVVTCGASAYVHRVAQELRTQGIALGPLSVIIVANGPLLVPHNGEVLLTITNLQWVLGPALLAFIVEGVWLRPQLSSVRQLGRVATALLLGLTGPYIIVFAPVWMGMIAWRLRHKLPFDQPLCAALALTTLIQALYVHFGDPLKGEAIPIAPDAWPPYYFGTFVRSFVVSLFYGHEVFLSAPSGLLLATMVAFPVVTYAIGMVASPRPTRRAAALLLGMTLFTWWVGVWRQHNPQLPIEACGHGSRYTFVPEIFTLWALWLMANNVRGPGRAALLSGVAIMPLVAMCISFHPARVDWTVVERPGPHGTIESQITAAPGGTWTITLSQPAGSP